MPVKSQPRERPERTLVSVFLSAYEDEGWKNAKLRWLEDEQDSAVEVLATNSDGSTLAHPHPTIQRRKEKLDSFHQDFVAD